MTLTLFVDLQVDLKASHDDIFILFFVTVDYDPILQDVIFILFKVCCRAKVVSLDKSIFYFLAIC